MPPMGTTLKIALVGVIILFVIFLIVLVVTFFPVRPSPQVTEEPVSIAIGTPEPSLLTLIAEDQGYFKKYGLNVTIRVYPAGAYAMNELLTGNADIASAAEFVGVANLSLIHI